MESEAAVHTDEGSPEAQSALAALARTLNINENALKTALNDAFDLLLSTAESPILALHLSFVRLSYRIDSKTLYEIVGAFRQTFGAALSIARVNYSTTNAGPSQYHGAYRALPTFAQSNRSIYMGPPQYSCVIPRSSNETVNYQYAQAYPPSWCKGYTGNTSSNRLQLVGTPADQGSSVLQGYQHPIISGPGDNTSSISPRDLRLGRYE